jgi:tRNA (guanine37-N1)-methyltransferase
MKIDIVTAIPELVSGFVHNSILSIAEEKGLADVRVHNLRDWTTDKRRTVDDSPFGGGPGMIMKIEPFVRAIRDLRTERSTVIMPTPQGEIYDQSVARSFLSEEHLIIICGHYKGIDGRINNYVDRMISAGDYILTGGELAAAMIADSVCRLIPGVISDIGSANSDSFENGLLDCDYFTRPAVFEDHSVPKVLLSGDHKAINEWRQKDSLEKTKKSRPDLIEKLKKLK